MMDQATSDDDKSYYEDYMKSLKDQLKTASDTREGAGDYSGDTFIGSVGDNEFMVTFYGSGDDMSTGGGFSLDYYHRISLYSTDLRMAQQVYTATAVNILTRRLPQTQLPSVRQMLSRREQISLHHVESQMS